MNKNKNRNRGGWSKESIIYLEQIKKILNDLENYWPLTLRQIYYQLVSSLIIENNLKQYAKLSRILTKARLDGFVSWDTIEDRARSQLYSGGWDNSKHFVQYQIDDFLTGYRRDLLQSQNIALELWVEKDALSRICHEISFKYCIPVIVARGFSSISYINNAKERILNNSEKNKKTIILYFGDLDPSGWEMLPAMLDTLQNEMKLGELVEGYRCALTLEQIKKYNLPYSIDAIKEKDPRTKKYVQRFGSLAVELDALSPPILENIVKQSIEEKLNLINFKEEQIEEQKEKLFINEIKENVRKYLDENNI
jgi:hypothetical protein